MSTENRLQALGEKYHEISAECYHEISAMNAVANTKGGGDTWRL